MAKITAIEPQKRDPDRVDIHIDGEHAFSAARILVAWLRVGQELSPQKIDSLLAADALERAYQQAAFYLSYRTRSEAEIRQFLRKHKVADNVIEQTLDRLRQNRLADDHQFARLWVENRAAFRPRGRRLLAWELQQKGLSSEAATSALSDLDEVGLAYQAGIKKARQLRASQWIDFRSKLSGFWARRGFPYPVIDAVISRLWHEMHTGQPISDDEVSS
jgi:regulatory protein